MGNDIVTGWEMAAYMGTKAVERLDLISHNLANASTTAFKQELLTIWRIDAEPEGPVVDLPRVRVPDPGPGRYPSTAYYLDVPTRDYRQGSLHVTHAETDLAIDGPGFFKIDTPRGLRYTRNGSFQINQDNNWLVTREGYPVLGKGGPITLDAVDKKFSIDPEGGIHLDDALGDQLEIVDFPNPQGLVRENGCLYAASAAAGLEQPATAYRIHQGAIEESNVDPFQAMIQLLETMRGFEAYLKVLETFESRDRKVILDIGRLT